MKSIFKATLILSSLFLLSCKNDSTLTQVDAPELQQVEVSEPSEVTLNVGESTAFGKYKVTFMEVSGDSRCPKGLECVQAGKAEVILLLAADDSAETLTLDTTTHKKYRELGISIEITKVSPYPKEGYFFDKKDFKLGLNLSVLSPEDYKIIDVRSVKEVAEGSYPNSVNIIHDQITTEILKLNLAKDTPIAVYCRSGRRAGWAKKALEDMGYDHVVNGINQTTLHQKFGTAEKF